MNRKGFTLIELMLAVFLGALVILMIGGTLRTAINAWEAVQSRVGINYHRRSVIDLLRRQLSSMFYMEDAQSLNQNTQDPRWRNNRKDPQRDTRNQKSHPQDQAFQLPLEMSYFQGEPQTLSFVSSLSYLSDFPGQVFVQYFVVQGTWDEETKTYTFPESQGSEDEDNLEHDQMDPLLDPQERAERAFDGELLEGDLFLMLSEENLFLKQTKSGVEEEDRLSPPEDAPEEGEEESEWGEDPFADLDQGVPVKQTLQLIGPLRAFTLRYRLPKTIALNCEDCEEEMWAETWDVMKENGNYPAAVELTLFYDERGKTDEWSLEDLPGIRLVIPLYNQNNLTRDHNGVNRSELE
jgi:prepilin-type N-terminal cleavage/methylation domain-containing protein